MLERGTGLKPVSLAWKARAQSIYQPRKKLVRTTRLELVTMRWQRSILPLNYIRIYGGRRRTRTLNPCVRSTVLYPVELSNLFMEVLPRVELGSQGFAVPRLTVCPKHLIGSGRWIRTTDTQSQSLMFYRLNYSGVEWRSRRESNPPHPLDRRVASPDAYESKSRCWLLPSSSCLFAQQIL